MSRWRIVLTLGLLAAPFIFMAGVGSYYLWSSGWGRLVWWPMAVCMVAGYLLGWYWQRKQRLLRPPDFEPPLFWTERDQAAWALVKARVEAATHLDPDKLTDFDSGLGPHLTWAPGHHRANKTIYLAQIQRSGDKFEYKKIAGPLIDEYAESE